MIDIALRHGICALLLASVAATGANAKPEPPALAASALPLAELPPQEMANGSCAMFLWERSTRRRVLMATAQPATVKVIHNGKATLLAQASAENAPVLGFTPIARYAGEAFSIGLDLTIDANEAGNAIVRDGTLTYTAADGAAVVAPVAGIIGCK